MDAALYGEQGVKRVIIVTTVKGKGERKNHCKC
jgi:hypothetical protein